MKTGNLLTPLFSPMRKSFLGLLLLGCALGNAERSLSVQSTTSQGEGNNAEPRTIKLETVHSTSDQKGLKHVRRNDNLDDIYRATQGMGASNLLLVRANDIAGAVFNTRSVFTGFLPADVVVGSRKSRTTWLVAYFGVAGSGTAWVVDSVKIKDKTIRLTYERSNSLATDIHQYFVWVPLGDLESGRYTLELFDAKQLEVTLMRRVSIPK